MRTEMEKLFGETIHEEVDAAYQYKVVGMSDQASWYEYLDAHPDVEAAMEWRNEYILSNAKLAPYYGGIEKYRSYYVGKMYDDLEEKYGKEIFDKNTIYQNYIRAGERDSAKAFRKKNEDLDAFLKERPAWYDAVDEVIAEFGDMLPEGLPMELREDIDSGTYRQKEIEEFVTQPDAPRFTRDEWVIKLGGPAVSVILNIHSGLDLEDAAVREYLGELAAQYDLSYIELIEAVGNSP
jgi:hypothetical protein